MVARPGARIVNTAGSLRACRNGCHANSFGHTFPHAVGHSHSRTGRLARCSGSNNYSDRHVTGDGVPDTIANGAPGVDDDAIFDAHFGHADSYAANGCSDSRRRNTQRARRP